MNIAETVSYGKDGNVERFPLFKKLFLALVIILIALLSFGIGRLSVVGKREGIRIEYEQAQQTSRAASVIGGVIASKNGNKYHYGHCAGAKQIKEENKVTFASPEAAEAAGYTLATNCAAR